MLQWTVLIFGLAFIAWMLWRQEIRPVALRRQVQRLVRNRAREAEIAATDASLRTAAYAPETIRASVVSMVNAAGELCRANDTPPSENVVGGRLVVKWSRLRSDLLSHGPPEDLRIELLRVASRGDDEEDLVSCRVRWRGRRLVADSAVTKSSVVDECWDLRRIGDDWRLVAFGPLSLTEHMLTAPQIIDRGSDSELMARESATEIAHRTTTETLTELIGPSNDVGQQLRDLSVVDDRFSDGAIRSVLVHLVDTWELAQLSSDARDRLTQLATRSVVRELMYPETDWKDAHLSVTDAVLRDWLPVSLVAQAGSVELTVDLSINALRHLAVAVGTRGPRPPGDRRRARPLEVRWTLRATDAEPAWQLVKTSNPTASVLRDRE